MTLNQLKRKVESIGKELYDHPNFKDNILTCDWDGCIEPVKFPMKVSEAYKEFIEENNLICCECNYTEIDNDIWANPALKAYGQYSYVCATAKPDNEYLINCDLHELCNGRIVSKTGKIFFFEDKILKPDISEVDYYWQGNCLNPEFYVGTNKDKIIYKAGDGIYSMSSEGKVKFVGACDWDAGKKDIKIISSCVLYKECGVEYKYVI